MNGWRIIRLEDQGLLVFGVCGKFLEPHDCEILDKPLLDLVEAIVIRVELVSGFRQELTVLENI